MTSSHPQNASLAPLFSFFLARDDQTASSELLVGGYDLSLAAPGAILLFSPVQLLNGVFNYWLVLAPHVRWRCCRESHCRPQTAHRPL